MLIYVAGPYTGDIDANINNARKIAAQLWEMGHAVLCPHLNTAHFEVDCKCDYRDYIRGDLDMISRCDALVIVPHYEQSKGTLGEIAYAKKNGIPVYFYPDVPALHPTEIKHPVQVEAFRSTVMRMYRVHLDKNMDYSPANILGTGEIGLVTRIWDKVARLLNLTGFRIEIADSQFDKPLAPKNESVDDSWMDLAVYAIIGILYRAKAWGK